MDPVSTGVSAAGMAAREADLRSKAGTGWKNGCGEKWESLNRLISRSGLESGFRSRGLIRGKREATTGYTSRGGMRRFHESRIMLQLSGRKQAVILIVTSRKEEHHGLVSRAVDRGRATRRQRGTMLSSEPPNPRKEAEAGSGTGYGKRDRSDFAKLGEFPASPYCQ